MRFFLYILRLGFKIIEGAFKMYLFFIFKNMFVDEKKSWKKNWDIVFDVEICQESISDDSETF